MSKLNARAFLKDIYFQTYDLYKSDPVADPVAFTAVKRYEHELAGFLFKYAAEQHLQLKIKERFGYTLTEYMDLTLPEINALKDIAVEANKVLKIESDSIKEKLKILEG